MSLLMDALRKAEKARKEQEAARTEATAPREAVADADREALSLDPMEASAAVPPPAPQGGEAPPPPSADTGELSLALEPEPEPAARPEAPAPGAAERSGELPVPEDVRLDEDTSATLPSLKAAQASVDEYFDGTRSMSLSMEQVRSAMDEEDTAEGRRPHADASGQRTARAVFDAGAVAAPRSASRSVAYVLLGLILLAALGVGGWIYWETLHRGPTLVARAPRTVPVRPSPQPAAPEPAPAPAASAPAATSAPAPAPASASASEEPPAPPLAQVIDLSPVNPPARGDLTPSREAPAPAPAPQPASSEPASSEPAPSGPAAEPAATAPESKPPAAGGDGKVAEADASLGDPDAVVDNLARAIAKVEGPASPIHIKRGHRAQGPIAALTAAYDAYQRGDDSTAAARWNQVLAADPRNRDALLGLAALELRSGHAEQAAERYRRVLAIDPSDTVAATALLQFQTGVDPVRSESYLRDMLAREPDASWLQFGLGNALAAQSRWAEAEEAYFEALRGAPDNPDFAYNLAVSLDHLEQPASAVRYYQRAVDLAATRTAGFDVGAVRERIAAVARSSAAQ